jgi:hypothetical protein
MSEWHIIKQHAKKKHNKYHSLLEAQNFIKERKEIQMEIIAMFLLS